LPRRRVSAPILRVEPTGSKQYLVDYYVKEFHLEAGKLKRKHHRKIGASWKPDKDGSKPGPATYLASNPRAGMQPLKRDMTGNMRSDRELLVPVPVEFGLALNAAAACGRIPCSAVSTHVVVCSKASLPGHRWSMRERQGTEKAP